MSSGRLEQPMRKPQTGGSAIESGLLREVKNKIAFFASNESFDLLLGGISSTPARRGRRMK
jgi:hypothetical protein